MTNRRVEQARDGEARDMAARYDGPDHWAPMTWPRCVVDGCTERLDPWLHRTRCDAHQANETMRREQARAIVAVNRERELTRRA